MINMQEFLYKQFTTNTGTHFLDSGGTDGRAWQQNQKKSIDDFNKQAEVELDAWYLEHLKEGATSDDLVPTVSTWHYMLNNLELDELCNEFNSLKCTEWNSDVAYGISTDQQEWLESHGLKLDGTWNSYNYETNLDHVLQGCNVYTEEDGSAFEYPSYMLIQLHLGADVRGGYTDAKLYKLTNEYFNTNPNVYGTIDGLEVSTYYNGYNLTDEEGNNVPVKSDSKISLYLEEY